MIKSYSDVRHTFREQGLGLSDALVRCALRAGVAMTVTMTECMRLIIAWRGGDERERERGGLKIGRSGRSKTIWAAVKRPQCWGQAGDENGG